MDAYILLAVWLISITAMFFVPKERRRESHTVFLFEQMTAWLLGLIVVEAGLLEYPFRELHANRTSFTFEFIAYPMVSVYYNLYFPQRRSAWIKLLYTLAFGAGITIPELWLETHTQLIRYSGWRWYDTLGSVSLTLFSARLYRNWFLHKVQMRSVAASVKKRVTEPD
ncbi:hypothetical protein B5M42_007290 [Paenibacillus athensensis]|nr:CBO0543 family protein [Paenibacillus athensensis]MCD1258636.1 hypothetical protein [Paenibacillus athensensis]